MQVSKSIDTQGGALVGGQRRIRHEGQPGRKEPPEIRYVEPTLRAGAVGTHTSKEGRLDMEYSSSHTDNLSRVQTRGQKFRLEKFGATFTVKDTTIFPTSITQEKQSIRLKYLLCNRLWKTTTLLMSVYEDFPESTFLNFESSAVSFFFYDTKETWTSLGVVGPIPCLFARFSCKLSVALEKHT